VSRARSALAKAGVTGLRTTPGYELEVNTSLEGTWRNHPVQAYIVPTASLPPVAPAELSLEGRLTVCGHSVQVVRGADSSVRMLRFNLGADTWLVASLNRDHSAADHRRSLSLVAALLAQA
jgi:hypothetical protein